MKFKLNQSIQILQRTPAVLQTLLSGLADDWINKNEGGDTWSAFDIVGHLLYGEKTDWMVRMEIILESGTSETFIPFDRFAQFNESKGKSMDNLLNAFTSARKQNIEKLSSAKLTEKLLDKKGVHPAFGEVTLRQLIATWTVHDLAHLSQITRVMAKQYKEETGPWLQYINLLKEKEE